MALIEVLVSLLLFSFGVLGLIGLEARSIDFSTDAEDRNRAALLANEIASSMWLANTAAVSAPDLIIWQARAADTTTGGLPNGSVTISTLTGNKIADVALSWKPPTRTTTDDRSTFTTRVILP